MRKISCSLGIYVTATALLLSSCDKLLEVPPPISSITTEEIFSNNKQADWAAAGMYSKMIHGVDIAELGLQTIPHRLFSAGLSTLQGALSADEITLQPLVVTDDRFSQFNKLTLENAAKPNQIWFSAYKTIFDANAIIDGIAASTSPSLIDSVRKQITGEALAIRAFSYFYLVNFFGDLPLVLSSDFKKSIALTRSSVTKIYDQIKADLVKARSLLAKDYSASKHERVRVNKWFAEALLARVYLYTGEYEAAISSATAVINQTALFILEQDLLRTFLPNSTESIFQLKPSITSNSLKNGTPEGYMFNAKLPTVNGPKHIYQLNDQLVAAFEANDKRKTAWVSTSGTETIGVKYTNGTQIEYYTVMRLAELFLIRAEATLLLMPAAKNTAIDDLNVLRRRAGVTELDYQLTADQVTTAIAHERRIELFLEWGHRWFDLKRTGKAAEVLSAISYKQPWLGNYQLLYPIPPEEIAINGNLIQNLEYESR